MSTHPFDTHNFASTKLKHVPQYLQAEAEDYNLKVAAQFDNYGNISDQVYAAMADQDRIWKLRTEEGWSCDEGGWYTPNGIHETDWEHDYGNPFPEQPVWKDYVAMCRKNAGWRLFDAGWYMPTGEHELSCELENLPEYHV